jgi:hypothetical protein
MNTASAYVTWQSWSEKWGHWNTWRSENQTLDNMETSDHFLREQRVLSKPASMILAFSEPACRDAFSTSSSVITPRPRTS